MESKRINEAFEKWRKFALSMNMRGYLWSRTQVDLISLMVEEQRKDSFTAGTDFGYKEGGVDFAKEIKKKWELKDYKKIPLWILNIIDTELKKAGE